MKDSRRKFFKTGVALIGGTVLGARYLSAMPIHFGKEVVNVGVIGTGDRGSGLIRLMNQIEGLEVVACSDLIPFRLEDAVKLTKSAKAYADYTDLLADKKVDAVIVSTPFSTHDEIAIAALKAGKHVYCEKTMTKGMTEIQAVIDIVNSSGKVFQTGHQYHSSPLYNKARDIIRSGYIGEVTAYECQWNRNGSWRRPVPDPKWERMINWRMYREYSGGLVAELMSHQIDFINWVTDSHPEQITGFGGIDHWKDGRETFDNVHLLYKYPSGLDASFECTTTNGYQDYQIKVLGSKGTIILDYTKGTIFSEAKGIKEKGLVDGVSGATMQAWEKGEGASIDAPGNDPTLDALRQFYESIANGAPVISSLQTGALTAKCVQISLDALYENQIKNWNQYPELLFS
ncbi:MAG: dehydrogenase [Flammeovirgaceae bacterium]|nr:dehydrogenase [Flammeovirgaceae bacterium]MBR07122.1 dehydrogenase [Rickettsiales bacterium]HCX24827.1 gfo/Idh/MocA family oxidoreductase [Cytophagales bacterium]|tara:strand:+ start:1732 stop:2934 length:1203 start_codon:yes stop_codon:yes gene_type:complete